MAVSLGSGDHDIFLEALTPPLQLFVVGATQSAVWLCRAAKGVGFHVTIIDPRETFATQCSGGRRLHAVWTSHSSRLVARRACSYVQ